MSWVIFSSAMGTVVFAMRWFFVYLNWIYQDDRKEGTEHWKAALAKAKSEDHLDEIHPDLIIVFHHPDHKYSDSAELVPLPSVKRIMAEGCQGHMPSLEHVKQVSLDGAEFAAKAAENMAKMLGGKKGEEEEELEEFAKKNVRKAILKDLYKQVPEWGFDIATFSSIDNDELFVAISVSSKEAIEYYMDREDIVCPLRDDIAELLGIGQDPADPCSHPPCMPRNQGIVSALHREGVLEDDHMDSLFKCQGNIYKGANISSKECIRIIFRELAGVIDLGAAKEEGLIVGWYPVHNPKRVNEFRVTWANWWNILHWSFVQPIPAIREYFGAKVAFQFAWNGVYAKGLLMLLLVSSLQVGTIFILQNAFGIYVLRNKQVIGFCITLALWSRIVNNMYNREEKFYCTLWNLTATNFDSIVRPQFIGVEAPSVVDTNLTEKVFSSKFVMDSKSFRVCVTSLVTLAMCLAVAACIFLWMVTFEGRMGTVASILLAVQIKIFGAIFHFIAVKITNYENHKYGDDYYNSFLWKLFLFEFVNNYSAFFFLTLWGKWRNIGAQCPGGDCLIALRTQLATTLFVICIFSVIGALLGEAMVKFWLWWEIRQYRKTFNKEPPPRLEMEEQAKYGAIGPKEEVMTTMPLMIALGYVLLFGGVSAAIIPLAFGLFAVHMRSQAILYLEYSQRTFPQMTPGIGSWSLVVQFLMAVGVGFSGFLFAGFGASFEGTPLVARLSGFLCFILFIVFAWAVLDMVFPPWDGSGLLLEKRRNHVLRKLTLRAAECEGSTMNLEALEAVAVASKAQHDAVETDDWASIPHLCDLKVEERAKSPPRTPVNTTPR
jgi:hypothetical protein